MKFAVVISLDNAAFDEDPTTEIARLLRDAAGRVDNGFWGENGTAHCLKDINGNTVGHFTQVEG